MALKGEFISHTSTGAPDIVRIRGASYIAVENTNTMDVYTASQTEPNKVQWPAATLLEMDASAAGKQLDADILEDVFLEIANTQTVTGVVMGQGVTVTVNP